MILAELILPIVCEVLSNQRFSTNTTFSSELIIIIDFAIRLSIALQKTGATEWFAADGTDKMLRMPLLPQRLDILSDYFFIAAIAVNHAMTTTLS